MVPCCASSPAREGLCDSRNISRKPFCAPRDFHSRSCPRNSPADEQQQQPDRQRTTTTIIKHYLIKVSGSRRNVTALAQRDIFKLNVMLIATTAGVVLGGHTHSLFYEMVVTWGSLQQQPPGRPYLGQKHSPGTTNGVGPRRDRRGATKCLQRERVQLGLAEAEAVLLKWSTRKELPQSSSNAKRAAT